MKKMITTVALAAVFASSLSAVPALRKPIKYTQPDGTEITLRKMGDERRHMLMTTDGRPVLKDAGGFYCFAELTVDGAVKASDVRVSELGELDAAGRRKVEAVDVEAVTSKIMNYDRRSRYDKRPARIVSRSDSHNGIGLIDDSFLGYTEMKGLVILAQYTDVKFDEMSQNGYFRRMLNEPGFDEYGGTGSARDYFIDNSNGKFIPQFDVYGPVTLPHSMAYYGANDRNGDDEKPAQMIYDACAALDDEINFKDYDCNGDGYVDNVFVFYAGYGEATYDDENTVWPHQWNLVSAGLKLSLDGVVVDKYACANELELYSGGEKPLPDGIGTFVHEFSHVIGLPDLYVTEGQGSWTPDMWSVLDYGPYNNNSRTPPAYSVYERNALGWCDPIVIDGPASIDLEAINTTNQAFIIPTKKQNEFFLLENRQQTGWDKYLPGHGMLIWHIDYNANEWYYNSVNNRESHNRVDIEEASGKYVTSKYNSTRLKELAAYPFPGTNNVTEFTDETKPSMRTWDGVGLNLPLTDIVENGGVISFNVAGGASDASVPEIAPAESVGKDYFVASWHAADGAAGYRLTVQADVRDGVESSVAVDFGSGSVAVLPQAWSFISSKGETYTTHGNYGQNSPSLKLAKTGAGFQTDISDREIKSIKFWLKGQGSGNGSNLSVEAMISGQWSQLSKVIPAQNTAKTVTIEDIPSGVHQIRIIYNKKTGNVAIDDFTITYGGSGAVTLDGYDDLDVGNVTSYRVDRLLADVSDYIYKVRAVDSNGHASAYSSGCNVSLTSTGIDDIVEETNTSVVTDGLDVKYHGATGRNVEVFDISGRVVALGKTDSEGNAVLTLPSTGVYIVVAGQSRQKIFVK